MTPTTPKFSLSRRIFALAFLNVALLMVVFLVFARYQFHLEFRSFLLAPVRDRLEEVAAAVAVDLEQTPVAARTDLMGRYAASYGVDFYLFDNEGPQIAGRPVQLPEAVTGELLRRPADPPPRGHGDDGKNPPGRRPRPREPGRLRPPADRPEGRGGRGGRGSPPPSVVRQAFQLSGDNMFWVGTRMPVAEPGKAEITRGTLILAAKSFYGTPLFFDFKPWLMAMTAVLGIFLVCWLPFIRHLTQTISRITRATEQMEQGNFDHQLPETRSDELGQLSLAINRMAARLSGFVKGQKRFLGDIAHELCAPIARMQFWLGILEQRAEPAELPALEDVQEEMRQMSGLVGELLSFSKAGIEQRQRPLEAVDVSEVARLAVTREAGACEAIRVDIVEPLMALADREFLLRSLCNLVRNAVRYAGDAGPVTISGRVEGGEVMIDVTDAGPGLPPEELDRIFTPFYRLEASRNREFGGAGLGLAIVKSCIEACQGTVRCRNRTPAGLAVEIRLAAALHTAP